MDVGVPKPVLEYYRLNARLNASHRKCMAKRVLSVICYPCLNAGSAEVAVDLLSGYDIFLIIVIEVAWQYSA